MKLKIKESQKRHLSYVSLFFGRQIQTLLHRCEKTDIEPFGQRTAEAFQSERRKDSPKRTKMEISLVHDIQKQPNGTHVLKEIGQEAGENEGRTRRTSKRQQQAQVEKQQKEQDPAKSEEHEFSIEDVVESPTPQTWKVGQDDNKALSDLEDWVYTF